MPLPLTNEEKIQLALFELISKKASCCLQEDSYIQQDIDNTKYQCVLLFIRKLCQVYKDLKDNSNKTKEIKKLIISYLNIICYSNIQKPVKREIEKFLKSPNIKQCDKIISAIYELNIEEFSLYILSSLITHINRGKPKYTKNK